MTPEQFLTRVRKRYGHVMSLALMTHWFELHGEVQLKEVIDHLPPPGRCRNPEMWVRRALTEGWVFRKSRRKTIRVNPPSDLNSYREHVAKLVLGNHATKSDYDQLVSSNSKH